MMKRVFPLVVVAVLAVAFALWWGMGTQPQAPITTFEECVAAGNLVMESYPRQCRDGNNTFVENIGNELEKADLIRIYFYNPALDQGPGGVQCSRNGLVAVERVIPKTTTPLTDAVKLLLRGEISAEEKAAGIESEFPLSGLTLKSATITDGVATLTFDDPQNKTGGGSCRVGILWIQIEATAKQFPTVKSVRFMPEELFQP